MGQHLKNGFPFYLSLSTLLPSLKFLQVVLYDLQLLTDVVLGSVQSSEWRVRFLDHSFPEQVDRRLRDAEADEQGKDGDDGREDCDLVPAEPKTQGVDD